MTKKDYNTIVRGIKAAQADKASVPSLDQRTIRYVAMFIADELEKENPRFDRGRFMFAAYSENLDG